MLSVETGADFILTTVCKRRFSDIFKTKRSSVKARIQLTNAFLILDINGYLDLASKPQTRDELNAH